MYTICSKFAICSFSMNRGVAGFDCNLYEVTTPGTAVYLRDVGEKLLYVIGATTAALGLSVGIYVLFLAH
jgi:hypothetical protein